MKRDLNEILDSCVSDIITNRKTINECLEANADVRTELEPLLLAAARMIENKDVTPSGNRTQQSRERLLAAVEQRRWETGIERKPNDAGIRAAIERDIDTTRRRFAVRLGIVTLIFAILSGATLANASQSSLPGSSLYPIKRALEGAKFVLAKDATTKQQLSLDVAENRIQELEQLPKDSSYYSKLAGEAEDNLEKARQYSPKYSPKKKLTENKNRLSELKDRNRSAIRKVLKEAPKSERPKLEIVLKRAEKEDVVQIKSLRRANHNYNRGLDKEDSADDGRIKALSNKSDSEKKIKKNSEDRRENVEQRLKDRKKAIEKSKLIGLDEQADKQQNLERIEDKTDFTPLDNPK